MALIPWADWIVKLIVFSCLFIAIHYLCGLYFRPQLSVILGAGVMVVTIMVSLQRELRKDKTDGGTDQQAKA